MSSGSRRAGASSAHKSSANGLSKSPSSTADASGLSQIMKSHVDELRTHLVCGICIRPLYEPFTIACGHTFCYSCLSAWFASSKTCPDCRSPVKAQPAPAYLIRTLVHTFTSRLELLDTGETTEDHGKRQREEAQRVERDKADTDPRTGGLFKGKFKAKVPIQQPVLDLEDNVFRCPVCSWELEEDEGCVRCGYLPDDASVTSTGTGTEGSDLDGNSEMTDYFDDGEDGFDETDDLDWNVFGVPVAELPPNVQDRLYDLPGDYGFLDYHLGHPRIAPATAGGRRLAPAGIDHEEEDEEEDEEDEDDMDSFIVDDINGEQEHGSESDHSTVVGDDENSTHGHYNGSQLCPDASMSDDGNDSLEEDASGSETGEDDEEDRIQPLPSRRMSQLNGYGTTNLQPFHSSARLYRRDQLPAHSVGSSSRTAINVDDESDEGPVGPVRRTRVRRGSGPSAARAN